MKIKTKLSAGLIITTFFIVSLLTIIIHQEDTFLTPPQAFARVVDLAPVSQIVNPAVLPGSTADTAVTLTSFTPSLSVIPAGGSCYKIRLRKVDNVDNRIASTDSVFLSRTCISNTTQNSTIPESAGLLVDTVYALSAQACTTTICGEFGKDFYFFKIQSDSGRIMNPNLTSTLSTPDLVASSDTPVPATVVIYSTDNITKLTNLTFVGTAPAGSTVTIFDSPCLAPAPTPPTPPVKFIKQLEVSTVEHKNFLAKVRDFFSIKKAEAGQPEGPDLTSCTNGIDDDNDNYTDEYDVGCGGTPPPPPPVQTAPVINFGADDYYQNPSTNLTIAPSCEAELVWDIPNNFTNDVSCTASATPATTQWTGSITPNYYYLGDKPLTKISTNQTRNYTLTCTNAKGTTSATATITVAPTAKGTATANSSGNWSITTTLNPGPHYITATATNISAPSTGLSVMVDQTAPVFMQAMPIIKAPATISYNLTEKLASGTITITRTGGNIDPAPPRVCNLKAASLTSGAHSAFNLSTGCTVAPTPLVNGAIYSVSYTGKDLADNTSVTVVKPPTKVAVPFFCNTAVEDCGGDKFFLVPDDVTKVDVEMWGGGGGGGRGGWSGAANYIKHYGAGGGGGGGGATYVSQTGISTNPGDVFLVQVGAAGLGQNNSTNTESATGGSASSVEITATQKLTANGGCAGNPGANAGNGVVGAGGGGCGNSGNGGSGSEGDDSQKQATGGGGGGGGALNASGSNGTSGSSGSGGSGVGGVGGIGSTLGTNINSACFSGSRGGNGGKGGTQGNHGSIGSEGKCGGGGGGGGGTGGGVGIPGAGGHDGGDGRVIIYYYTYFYPTYTSYNFSPSVTPASSPEFTPTVFECIGTCDFKVPLGAKKITVEIWGGGGGGGAGGNGNHNPDYGGGGGAGGQFGEYKIQAFTATPATPLKIVAGAGGKPGGGNVAKSASESGGESYVTFLGNKIISAGGGGGGANGANGWQETYVLFSIGHPGQGASGANGAGNGAAGGKKAGGGGGGGRGFGDNAGSGSGGSEGTGGAGGIGSLSNAGWAWGDGIKNCLGQGIPGGGGNGGRGVSDGDITGYNGNVGTCGGGGGGGGGGSGSNSNFIYNGPGFFGGDGNYGSTGKVRIYTTF